MSSLPRSPLRLWSGAIGLIGVTAAAWGLLAPAPYVLLIGGDTQGNLAPCGCTEPMTGGIRRLATAVSQYRGIGRSGFIENGGLIQLTPQNGAVGVKQNEMKAETLAEAFGAMGVDAINLGPEEAASGQGLIREIIALSGQKAISTSVDDSQLAVARWVVSGPCLIGGATMQASTLAAVMGGTPLPPDQAARALANEAVEVGKVPVLMLRGDLDQAKSVAQAVPSLRLIVYATLGTAPPAPDKVGETLLVTPGSDTKNLVRLELIDGRFAAYSTVTLDPGFRDDPKATRLYHDYLHRVAKARLIEQLTREKTPAFDGSLACMKCHASAYAVWHASAHAHALADLEKQGHDRDPDCLGCHVTGLQSLQGFRTRLLTPRLANVTCESCHGPSQAHALDPKRFRLPKLTEAACLPCHTTDNSPGFQFKPYWKRVFHHK